MAHGWTARARGGSRGRSRGGARGGAREGAIRRSGRLAVKPDVNLCEDSASETTEISDISSLGPSGKRPKLGTLPTINEDSDFALSNTTSSGSEGEVETPSPDRVVPSTPPTTRKRAAAVKARKAIEISSQVKIRNKRNTPKSPELEIDPEIMKVARLFSKRPMLFLKPPVLSPNRLVVDERSIWLYAEEGAKDLWASALSSTRFNGPRRHPPWRELYRLTDPDPNDISDWAENIRWAKQQRQLFGSVTWTEYYYHLEQITEHRRSTFWVSEEAIRAGMK